MSLADRASQAIDSLVWLRSASEAELRWAKANQDTMQERMAAAAKWCLRTADAYWWELPICNIISAAAKSLPSWTVRSELFPVESGFFQFAESVEYDDRFSGITGFAWAPYADSIAISLWALRRSEWFAAGMGLLRPGLEVAATGFGKDTRVIDPSSPLAAPALVEDPEAESTARLMRVVGASLLFLEQRIAISSVEAVDRISRRRLDKADIEYPALRVIRLRAIKHSVRDLESEPVDWQYRWMVRGHWRQQWHASDGSHRPQWIAPYIKGPDDKPVKAPKASVFAVVR